VFARVSERKQEEEERTFRPFTECRRARSRCKHKEVGIKFSTKECGQCFTGHVESAAEIRHQVTCQRSRRREPEESLAHETDNQEKTGASYRPRCPVMLHPMRKEARSLSMTVPVTRVITVFAVLVMMIVMPVIIMVVVFMVVVAH